MSTMKNEVQTSNTPDYADYRVCMRALHNMKSTEMFYVDHDLNIISETEYEIGLSNLESCHNGFVVTLVKALDYDDNDVVRVVFRDNGFSVINRPPMDFDTENEALEWAFEYIADSVNDDFDKTIHPTRFEALTAKVIAMTAASEGMDYDDDLNGEAVHIWFRDGETKYQMIIAPDMAEFKGGFGGLGAVVATFTEEGQSTKFLPETQLIELLANVGGAQ